MSFITCSTLSVFAAERYDGALGSSATKSGDTLTAKSSWDYVLGGKNSTALAIAEIYNQDTGKLLSEGESEKVGSKASTSCSTSMGYIMLFETYHYGATTAGSSVVWGGRYTYPSNYKSSSSKSSAYELVSEFNDNVVEDFGYNLDDFTSYNPFDNPLRDDVMYYFLFEMEREVGSTFPSVYKHNSSETYLVVNQDENEQNTITTLTFDDEIPVGRASSPDNDSEQRNLPDIVQPTVSVEVKSSDDIDFQSMTTMS
jgi:hypothetical protein